MKLGLLALCTLALGLTGFTYHVPSHCKTQLYLPPMPGTPQATAQTIRLRPVTTATFRLRYGTVANKMSSWGTGGAAGQEITADTRGEFATGVLSADTRYYYRVECSEGGQWRRGWEGKFNALPSSGGTIQLLVSSDSHFASDVMGSDSMAGHRLTYGIDLMRRYHDAHGYVDLGDTFMSHCHLSDCDDGYNVQDQWGRRMGDGSITESAVSEATEKGYAEARYSLVLRRMWPALRNLPQVWSRGNHDTGGGFGGNDPATNQDHWQLRTTWVTTGISLDLPADINVGTGVFSKAGHGMGDGDGPYRIANADPSAAFTAPPMSGCNGNRASSIDTNEWYVRDIDGDTFKLAYGAALAGCIGADTGGTGTMTLLAGSDMQEAVKDAIAEYLPHQNDVVAAWAGLSQDHIIGPVPMSDYVLLLNLDEYDFTGLGTCASDPRRLPDDARAEDCSWSLGSNQETGAFAAIDEIADGDGDYEDVEILIITMHGGLGGFGQVGYPYGRGSLCEVDSTCVSGGEDCVVDDDCTGADTCEVYDCTEDFAHPKMQTMQEKMASMVSRTNGIALVLLGHDHFTMFGEKSNSGVYYLNIGQPGGPAMGPSSWAGLDTFVARYDFDGDTVPAYLRHGSKLSQGSNYHPPGEQNALVERGTEHRGIGVLTMVPAAESDSGNTELSIDWIINAWLETWWPEHGQSPHGLPFLVQGD